MIEPGHLKAEAALPPPEQFCRRIPHLQHLGMRYLPACVENHSAPVFILGFQDRLVGNTHLPALHGGAVASFMENSALLHLLMEQNGTSRLPKLIDFNIDYLRSAGPRDSFACCEVAKLGSRVVLVHIRCWQRHFDRPAALARAHYLWEPVSGNTELAEDIRP